LCRLLGLLCRVGPVLGEFLGSLAHLLLEPRLTRLLCTLTKRFRLRAIAVFDAISSLDDLLEQPFSSGSSLGLAPREIVERGSLARVEILAISARRLLPELASLRLQRRDLATEVLHLAKERPGVLILLQKRDQRLDLPPNRFRRSLERFRRPSIRFFFSRVAIRSAVQAIPVRRFGPKGCLGTS
jgi:hypothetical protein